MRNTTGQQGISTLDVLWAFYLSQPRKVKEAFRMRLENQVKAERQKKAPQSQWQKDLKAICSLKAGWDEENAPRISSEAISHVSSFVALLDTTIANGIRLYPTRLGAVMLKLETEKGRVKCEIGDKQMSYFVKREGRDTEYHSFEDINSETLSTLKSNLEGWRHCKRNCY